MMTTLMYVGVRVPQLAGSNKASAPLSPAQYFKFVGRFLGKAIYDVQLVDLPFCTALYRHLLGQPVGIPELEEMDEVSPPPPYLLPPLHLVGLLTSTYPALQPQTDICKVARLDHEQ